VVNERKGKVSTSDDDPSSRWGGCLNIPQTQDVIAVTDIAPF